MMKEQLFITSLKGRVQRMPNWVINNVTVKGEKKELERFQDFVKSEEEPFDFNEIIPMPESLNVVSGGHEDEAIIYYASNRLVKDFEDLLDDPVIDKKADPLTLMFYGSKENWIREHIDRIKKNFSEKEKLDKLYEDGAIYYDNVVKYGSSSWYKWCCDNWGTKWNASDAFVGEPLKIPGESEYSISISFETAWSAPFNIFEELLEQFPDLDFSGEYADEDLGSNCGRWKDDGGYLCVDDMTGTSDGFEFACEVWGYDPEEFEEDEDDEDEYEYDEDEDCDDIDVEVVVVPELKEDEL